MSGEASSVSLNPAVFGMVPHFVSSCPSPPNLYFNSPKKTNLQSPIKVGGGGEGGMIYLPDSME